MHQRCGLTTLRALCFTFFTGPFIPSSLRSSLAPSVPFLPVLHLISFPFTSPFPSFPLLPLNFLYSINRLLEAASAAAAAQ